MISNINESNFKNFIANNPTCIVMFTGSWCGPCKVAKPKVEVFAKNTGVATAYADIDDTQATAQSLGIMSVPTFIRFENGKATTQLIGATDDGLKTLFRI